jgi:aldehyde dehydrogenase (NAD+)
MQYEKIPGYIESGKAEGATLHLGSKRSTLEMRTATTEPTIFTNVKPDMTASKSLFSIRSNDVS